MRTEPGGQPFDVPTDSEGAVSGSGPPRIPHAQADYAVRLLEKGYTIAELARLIEVDVETMTSAIEQALARR